jgi:hypothetical protein
MLAAHPPELRIMANQVREFPSLLDEIDPCQSGDAFFESPDAKYFRQHHA